MVKLRVSYLNNISNLFWVRPEGLRRINIGISIVEASIILHLKSSRFSSNLKAHKKSHSLCQNSNTNPNPEVKCMSFVPAPQKATTAGSANATNSNGPTSAVTNAPPAAGEAAEGGEDAFITSRTFDLYWVDKSALMYKDGYVKVRHILLFDEGIVGKGGVNMNFDGSLHVMSMSYAHIMT